MLKRFLGWIKNHPVGSFFLIIFFPVYGFIFFLSIAFPIGMARDWYYEKFPFSSLAVWLFAEPGEDTLMFRYRLGDRLLYVRSDMAEPARYWGRESTICNPLWGECPVRPMFLMLYREVGGEKICIGRYPECPSSPDIPYARQAEFLIYYSDDKDNSKDNLINNACDYINDRFIYGKYRGYDVNRIYGRRQAICPLVQPDGVLDSLLTAMETGNYDRFPRNRQKISAD